MSEKLCCLRLSVERIFLRSILREMADNFTDTEYGMSSVGPSTLVTQKVSLKSLNTKLIGRFGIH